MTKIHSKALDSYIEVERIIGYNKGAADGPTLVFFAGIHGNEPSGVFALHKVFENLRTDRTVIRGSIYGISGNLWALQREIRYQEEDLNRIWTKDRIQLLMKKELNPKNEDEVQLMDIYKIINRILTTEKGPFYFFDLHTTSSKTIPFLTVNDSLLNRKFTQQYPSKIILGIEEYLEGPLLSYLNEQGYVSFGFEAGQHDDPKSIENHISFIYLTMAFAGSLDKDAIEFQHHYKVLAGNPAHKNSIYEIFWRYEIKNGENFSMRPGFENFQIIEKGEPLAFVDNTNLTAPKKGKIFMPLYQNQGDDGVFIIRKVPSFYLMLSKILRKIHLDRILPWLPGVKRISESNNTLAVNLSIARFFAKPFLHLLGFRSKQIDKNHLVIKNREKPSKKETYVRAPWY